MTYIKWDEECSIKIEKIEEQHKQIFNMLEGLLVAMAEGKNREVLADMAREVNDYANYHFRTEEELMRKYDYPDFDTQRKEHDAFSQKAAKLLKDVEEGKQSVTLDMVQLLSNWMEHHIKEEDKKYEPFLTAKGVH